MRGARQERYSVSFVPLGLTPELLRAVADEGYIEPTPVQAESIPLVLDGRDVLAGAQTGTGKTAAFVLPILQRLHASADPIGASRRPGRPRVAGAAAVGATRGPPIRCLILAPTRELALQVEESVRTYGRSGPSARPSSTAASATTPRSGPSAPARDRRRHARPAARPRRPAARSTWRVEILVLDEADRMLDMGFIRDIRRILELLPPRRQTLLFSATFSTEIRRLADGILDRPVQVQVTPRNTTVELVRQVVHPVDRERKRELLSHLIRSGRIDQALVFTRTKHGANRLAEQLGRDGIAAAAIHGNRSQSQRVRALADFKAGRVAILVATDIAARGIDIDSMPHVVNFELPMAPEDYVHRIGRTARAGLDGDAISLVCVDESKLLWQIESLLRTKIAVELVEGFAPDRSIRPQPILLRQGAGRPRPAMGYAPQLGRGRAERPNLATGGPPGACRPGPPAGVPASLPTTGRPSPPDRPASDPRPAHHHDRRRRRPATGGSATVRRIRPAGRPWPCRASGWPATAGDRAATPARADGASSADVPVLDRRLASLLLPPPGHGAAHPGLTRRFGLGDTVELTIRRRRSGTPVPCSSACSASAVTGTSATRTASAAGRAISTRPRRGVGGRRMARSDARPGDPPATRRRALRGRRGDLPPAPVPGDRAVLAGAASRPRRRAVLPVGGRSAGGAGAALSGGGSAPGAH